MEAWPWNYSSLVEGYCHEIWRGERGWSTKVCRRAHGCGLWWSISEWWESFSKHLSFVVGDGFHILFWYGKWIGDNPLKTLYLGLYECSDNKESCVYDVLCLPLGGNDKVLNLRFYMDFHDSEASFSFLNFIQSWIPRVLEAIVYVGALMEGESLILSFSTIIFGMFLLQFSLGRTFGKHRFLKGWLF